MDNYLSLTKVFLKSSLRRTKSNRTRTKIIFGLLLFFTILFIIIPFLIVSASFVYDTTIQLMDIEYESIGLQIMCYIICIFTFIFSISALLNELYFSTDIEKLLPLPIKPVQLISSKFTVCYILENIMQIFLILVSIISYMLALHLKVPNLLISLLQIVTLPIIPMVYATIFCLIIMYFTKFIKNKESVKKISTLFVIILFVLLIRFINSLKGFDFNAYLESFVNGNHKFLDTMNYIFPQIRLFTDTLTNMNVLSLIKYIILNVVYIGIMLLLAKKVYLNSVIDLSNKNTNNNKNYTKLLKNIKQENVVKTYLGKEFKTLVRTPSFFINCMIINILWPVIIYALYQIGTIRYDFNSIKVLLSINNDKIKIILLLFIVGISLLIPAMNSIASSSFSREGKNYQFIKYIPLSYKKQWFIKYLISFLISFVGIFVYTFIFYIVVGMNILSILQFIVISMLSISAVSFIGLYIDSLQPKLNWDDENNALRENYNTFISMGIVSFIFILTCIGSYNYLYKTKMFGFEEIYLAISGLLLFINLIILIISNTDGIKNMIEQE